MSKPKIKMMPTIDLREVLDHLEKQHPGIKRAILDSLEPVSNGCHISMDMIDQEDEWISPEYAIFSRWIMKEANLKSGDWILADVSW